ncbi:MAG: hypothetical protein ABSA92_14515 [Candidatus Bathyarchaeia archaeon]
MQCTIGGNNYAHVADYLFGPSNFNPYYAYGYTSYGYPYYY